MAYDMSLGNLICLRLDTIECSMEEDCVEQCTKNGFDLAVGETLYAVSFLNDNSGALERRLTS